ncbi:MAG TPA: LamG domain-containing protein [Porticoccus sp.]|nr:LamG domain-containing protein [Porticoccus sp.]
MSDPHGPFHSTFGDLPTATEEVELNRTLAAGLAEASKVVVLDANKDASGFRNLFTQSQRNLYSDRPYYRLDGSNDYIEYADDVDLDMVTYDFALRIVFKPDSVSTANQFLMNKTSATVGWGLEMRQDDLWIHIDDNTLDSTAKIGTAVFEAGVIADVIVNFDRDGNATANVNGVNVGTVDISGTPLTLSNANVLRIGTETGGTTKPFKGEIYDYGVWNALIPEAQIFELQSGGGLNFLDIGASSLNLLDEPDFATHAKWSATGKATDSTGEAEWTFAAGALGGTVIQTSGNRIATGIGGKRYRFVRTTTVTTAPDGDTAFTITNAFGVAAVSLTMTAGIAEVVEFTSIEAAASGSFVLDITETTATEGQFAVDDLVLNQIGNVLHVGGDSFASGFAYDKSGNGLKGTVNGATLHNIEVSGDWTGITYVSVGSAHTNTVKVTVQFTDAAGNDISHSVAAIMYLADDTAGLVYTGTLPDGANAINADGAAVELITDQVWSINTESDGDFDFDIKHTAGAHDWYMVIVLPDGRLAVSSKIEITA